MKIFQIFPILLLIFLTTILLACSESSQPELTALPEGSIILAFGDSLTYGTGATQTTNFPANLANFTGFKVVNAGVPGEETQQGLERIDSVLDDAQPQLVIVCLGGNDMLHKRPHAMIKTNLINIIRKIQSRGIQVVLIAVPDAVLTMRIPDFFAEIGKELQIPVDTHTLRKLLRDEQYKSDYIHLNAQGYRLMALGIAKLLKQQGAIETIHE